MDGYEGPGGWNNIGMNPFERVQSRLKRMLEEDRKESGKTAPSAPAAEPEPTKVWDPFGSARKQRATSESGTQRFAEATQREFMTRVIRAVEPIHGVDSKKASSGTQPRQFQQPRTPTSIRPGQPSQSRYGTPQASPSKPRVPAWGGRA